MSTSLELRVLAKKIEQNAHDIMSKVSPSLQEKYAKSFASSINELESLAESMEGSITDEHLNALAKVATALDSSDNPALHKQAILLDGLLLAIAAPKKALAGKVTEDELNKLRAEYRIKDVDRLYKEPKQALDKQNNVDAVRKAIETQVKTYVPMEAPLSTRYPPDRPGGHQTRIADNVYQDILTGKIYNYRTGYTTDKGNKVPGGAVEYQIPELNDVNNGHTLFDIRELLMSRYAGEGLGSVLKSLGQNAFMTREVPEAPGEREAAERTMLPSESPEIGKEIESDIKNDEITGYMEGFTGSPEGVEGDFESFVDNLLAGQDWKSLSAEELITRINNITKGKEFADSFSLEAPGEEELNASDPQLTEEDIAELLTCENIDQWEDMADRIKEKYGGEYPSNWYEKVLMPGGVFAQLREKWDNSKVASSISGVLESFGKVRSLNSVLKAFGRA